MLQVHLVVDTTLAKDKIATQAYVSRTLTLGDKALATEFVEVPCDVLFGAVEKVGGALSRSCHKTRHCLQQLLVCLLSSTVLH